MRGAAGVKAVCLEAPRSVSLLELEPPQPGPNQVLVKVLGCGVCGSDLNAWRGVPGISFPLSPGMPGHEVWGELADGTQVTGLMSGGYAEYCVANRDELLAVPERWRDRPLLGEPLACAMGVAKRAGWSSGQSLAVVGFGYLAALAVSLMAPATWVAFSRRTSARELALSLGASAAYDYSSVPESCWDSFDVVIEAAGAQQTLDVATWLTTVRGRLVIAGYHADGARTVNMQSWNWKGLDVINAHERDPRVYMRNLWEALERLNKDPAELITHEWSLRAAADAFTAAENHPEHYVKAIVRP